MTDCSIFFLFILMVLGTPSKLSLGPSLVSSLQQWAIVDADAHEQGKHVAILIQYSETCGWQVSWAKNVMFAYDGEGNGRVKKNQASTHLQRWVFFWNSMF